MPYPNNLPDWFDKSEYHIVGDEELEYFRVNKEGPDHHRIQMAKNAHHVKDVPVIHFIILFSFILYRLKVKVITIK